MKRNFYVFIEVYKLFHISLHPKYHIMATAVYIKYKE